MDIKQIKIDDLNALLRVKVSPVDYKDKVDETLKSIENRPISQVLDREKYRWGSSRKSMGLLL